MNGTTNTGGPAFPVYDHHADGRQFLAETGMTMRDYFAAKAMQGLLASPTDPTSFDAIGVFAYNCADAMLKARGDTE